jgi:hypothetical protein
LNTVTVFIEHVPSSIIYGIHHIIYYFRFIYRNLGFDIEHGHSVTTVPGPGLVKVVKPAAV